MSGNTKEFVAKQQENQFKKGHDGQPITSPPFSISQSTAGQKGSNGSTPRMLASLSADSRGSKGPPPKTVKRPRPFDNRGGAGRAPIPVPRR